MDRPGAAMAARQTITSRTFIFANRGVCRKVMVVLGEKLNQGVRSGIGTALVWGGGEWEMGCTSELLYEDIGHT